MRKIIHKLMLCFVLLLFAGGVQSVQAAGTETVYIQNGATDKEINAALEKNANRTDTDLVVNISPGTYYLDKTLWVYSNTTINAAGATFYKTGKGSIVENRLVNDCGGYTTTTGITIKGGTWSCEPLMNNSEGRESFRFIHASKITIENVTVCNVPRKSHLLVLAGCADVTVNGSTFYGEKNYKMASNVKEIKEAIQLDVVHSITQIPGEQAKAGKVYWDDLPCKNITITKCTVYDFARGIGSHTAVKGIYHDNVKIRGCTISNVLDAGIYLYYYINSDVIGNTISNAGKGIACFTNSTQDKPVERLDGKTVSEVTNFNITIDANTIQNIVARNSFKETATEKAVAIRVRGSEDKIMSEITIKNNTIGVKNSKQNPEYGIYVSFAPKVKIESNKEIRTKNNAILVDHLSHEVSVKANKNIYSGNHGISIKDSNAVRIEKNKICEYKIAENCHGISLVNAGGFKKSGTKKYTRATISGNTIRTNSSKTPKKGITKSHGINVSSSNYVTLDGNTIYKSAENGVNVVNSTNVTINKNSIQGANCRGISVSYLDNGAKKDPVNAIVTNNTVAGFKTEGIYVRKSKNAKINSNKKVSGYKGASKGIVAYECANAKVESNTVIGYKDIYAIEVNQCPSASVKNNTVTKRKASAKEQGIIISNCKKAKVSGNKAIGYSKSKGLIKQ